MSTNKERLNYAAIKMLDVLTNRAKLGDKDAQAFMMALDVAVRSEDPAKHLVNFLKAYPALLKEFGYAVLAGVFREEPPKSSNAKKPITRANLFPAPSGVH